MPGKGLSSQVAAREVRYDFFNRVLTKLGAERLALGHHADDQAESVLLNIFRGTGTNGLAGMLPFRDKLYMRPLLTVRRAEIEQYCKDNGLSYRLDSSNFKKVYRRNKIRAELIPLLEKEYSPGLVPLLGRLAELARSDEDYLEAEASKVFKEVLLSKEKTHIAISRQKLSLQPTALARRVIRNCWGAWWGKRMI
ncbi:hypothetical protein N752_16495 [Desulforamulus aquiferis]|nr:tRNA lysidine(34) synthetase TilS [Desulforamulus aquiferis]RYD03989.1 hypothetical protein N752_16495 [Desulforamulus aquiferis]